MIRPIVPALLALVGVLVGCNGGETTMFPAPILLQDPRLDFARFVAPEHRGTDVRVLYATTRTPAPAGDPEHYTRRAGNAMRLGIAQVQLGDPGWSFADLVESDRTNGVDPLRPARITSVEEFGVQGSDADRALVDAIDR